MLRIVLIPMFIWKDAESWLKKELLPSRLNLIILVSLYSLGSLRSLNNFIYDLSEISEF